MSTTIYALEDIPKSVQDLIITHARLVVHTQGRVCMGSTLSLNHWSIYLIHAAGCIRLNMASVGFTGHFNGPSQRGKLIITSHSWATEPRSAITSWDFQAANNVRIQDITQILINNGRWRFELSSSGLGCRHWVYVPRSGLMFNLLTCNLCDRFTVMADMAHADYVSETSIDGSTVRNVIDYNYSRLQDPQPSKVQNGTFLPSPLYNIPPEIL